MKIFKLGETVLRLDDNREKQTGTLTINPVKMEFVYNPSCVSYHNNVPKK